MSAPTNSDLMDARDERVDFALDIYLTGTRRRKLAAAIIERFGVPQRTASRDVTTLFEKYLPSAYSQGEIGQRLNIAVLRAEEAHRQAWDELRALQRGDYDYETQHGSRRPPSAPYLGQIVAAQRHLAEVTGCSASQQIWSERKQFEAIKVGALAQMMRDLDQMTDDELKAEALRMVRSDEGNDPPRNHPPSLAKINEPRSGP